MRSLGVQFGLALQMTNILRDVPRDLRMGRCYLPDSELEKVGLRADDLLDSANDWRARPILAWGIRRALEHFGAAEQYILAIPRRNLRLRLATLWPVLIGLGTLAELAASGDWLNPNNRYQDTAPRRLWHNCTVRAVRTLECPQQALDKAISATCRAVYPAILRALRIVNLHDP